MKIFLKKQSEVYGIVKPGAVTKSLMESATNWYWKTYNGWFPNNVQWVKLYWKNDSRNVFKNVVSFVKSVNHTNIILLSVPFRYDLKDSWVNNKMKSFNRKLLKLTNIFPHGSVLEIDSNRFLYTEHGLHLNGLGTEFLSNQLVLHVYSLKEDTVHPITLVWHNDQLNA